MNKTADSKQGYRQPAYWICAGLLAVCGLGLSAAVDVFGGALRKEPLPLLRPFKDMDRQALSPYRVLQERRIEDPDVLKSLGTEDYLQWVLQDTDTNSPDRVEQFLLFVTYYALPDRVPHVPEECYLGSGFQQLATDHVSLVLDNPSLPEKIEAKYLVFGQTEGGLWQRNVHVPVLYFFRVNGEYASDRDDARLLLNKNLFGKSSYFCKVELVFNRSADALIQKQVIAAGAKVLNVLLPVLEKEHWPSIEQKGKR